MTWRSTEDVPLPEPKMTQFSDVYNRQQDLMFWFIGPWKMWQKI